MKAKITNFLLRKILGKHYNVVKEAMDFSIYTHKRRGEHASANSKFKVLNEIGMNHEPTGKGNN